jgi:hypothetical protein
MEFRVELQKKVENRRNQLRQALLATEGDAHQLQRRQSLEAVSRLADDALQGGWENVSEVAAAELTKWLQTSESMVVSPAVTPPAAA